ncbi:hypothetical protein ACP4OV_026730 [Aristida adscensionis]
MAKTRRQHASRDVWQKDEAGPSHGIPSKKRKHGADRISLDEKKEGTRHRASPAHLVKLNRHLSDDQKKLIRKNGFGGLLEMKCAVLPSALVYWLLGHYDSAESSIIIPRRGSIEVSIDYVHRILGLRKGDRPILYDFDNSAINFVHDLYELDNGQAPRIVDMVKKVEQNKEADDAFLRSWVLVAVSTFLCPTTCLRVSPRIYAQVVKLNKLNKWDSSQLIVDHLNSSVGKMDKRNFVTGCMFFLMVLYLDSLAIDSLDIARYSPILGAWTRKLVEAAMKLDINRDGSFGKLKSGMFGCLADIQAFVSSKAFPGTSDEQ